MELTDKLYATSAKRDTIRRKISAVSRSWVSMQNQVWELVALLFKMYSTKCITSVIYASPSFLKPKALRESKISSLRLPQKVRRTVLKMGSRWPLASMVLRSRNF